MEHISEHYSEQEGERDYCEYWGIDFLVLRDSVSVHYFLERPGESIGFDEGGYLVFILVEFINLWNLWTMNVLPLAYFLDFGIKDVLVLGGTPE